MYTQHEENKPEEEQVQNEKKHETKEESHTEELSHNGELELSVNCHHCNKVVTGKHYDCNGKLFHPGNIIVVVLLTSQTALFARSATSLFLITLYMKKIFTVKNATKVISLRLQPVLSVARFN